MSQNLLKLRVLLPVIFLVLSLIHLFWIYNQNGGQLCFGTDCGVMYVLPGLPWALVGFIIGPAGISIAAFFGTVLNVFLLYIVGNTIQSYFSKK